MKHEAGGNCPLCFDKLKSGDPALKVAFLLIMDHCPDAHISWCFRNAIDQNNCFSEGASRLKFPHSQHNQTKNGVPYSRAIDLFRLTDDGQARFEYLYFKQIADMLKSFESDLMWSGYLPEFKRFPESCHFQLKLDF